MKGDLHVHSTASDGTFTPSELVAAALAAELDVIAIADHDTVAGQREALAAAEPTSLRLIPAVELSCVIDDADVHILGFHVDIQDPHLLERLELLKNARLRRAELLVRTLTEAGFAVNIDEVLLYSDGGSVGRSHIARALVAAGHAVDVHEAFDRFIGRGKPFYVPKEAQTAAEAVQLIHGAGGVAIVAHPGIGDVPAHFDTLLEAGIDGIEAYHADHTAEQRALFARYAEEHALLTSGGTDFHGPSAPNPYIGDVVVPSAVVERIVRWTRAS
ncbi:MAG TPA: PHP domain-containing protein [Coriobacteriia bacterium]|nr:PHP domain-containing protein [Coriobacteriia bacterium]